MNETPENARSAQQAGRAPAGSAPDAGAPDAGARDSRAIAAMSFEEAMRELEATVGKLEHGEATLEESIALYERGALLRAHCEARLKSAQERVEKITLSAQGEPVGTTPFEGQ